MEVAGNQMLDVSDQTTEDHDSRPRSGGVLAKSFRKFPTAEVLCKAPFPVCYGFTLIELLFVITIIVVLLGLLFPAFRGVQNQANKTQAKNDLTQIVTAVNGYYTEYGKYPVATDDMPIANTGNLFYTLRAVAMGANLNDTTNPRKIIFLSPPEAKDQTTPRSGIKNSDGKWYDPWGTPYNIAIDGDYDNQITPNPYGANNGAGSSPLRQGVIAWSFGKDGAAGKNGNNIFTNSDDVISWQ